MGTANISTEAAQEAAAFVTSPFAFAMVWLMRRFTDATIDPASPG